MKHTEEYTWEYAGVKKGKPIFKHRTKESIDDVTSFLDNEGVDYIESRKAYMITIFYNEKAYQYFYTTGRWAQYSMRRGFPKKHYHSTGVKDFLTRFLRKRKI